MKFGIHNSSWLDTPDPAEAFETVKAKAQRAEETHLQFSPKVFFQPLAAPSLRSETGSCEGPQPMQRKDQSPGDCGPADPKNDGDRKRR
jgi:hypothetical protein